MEDTIVSLAVAKKGGERKVGACVYKRLPRKTLDDKLLYSLELVEFLEENEQYSTLDAFLVQIGNCILYLSDELEDASSGEGKKIQTLLDGRDIHEIVYVKKSNYQRKSDFTTKLSQLVGQATHVVNVAESERPLASNCAECLINVLRLTAAESEDYIGHVDVLFGSVNAFMRIDSSVAEAVNLLPKADHPSQFGSIYGVLNRCKTKMGSRLLDKWLRQPLIKVDEINERLDIVEILKETATYRNRLCDGPMKGMPDIDAVASKMQKKNAGLEDAFRVYVFSRSIPSIVSILNEAVDSFSAESEALMKGECAQKMVASLKAKFIQPLESLDNKFNMFQQLIEHVIDMDQLPNVEVNPAHDTELQELRDERDALEAQAEGLLQEARSGFASFASVHLDKSSQHGIAFRTTKGDDERQLRANNHKVNILSILKNGVHFTTPALSRIGDRLKDIEADYRNQQSAVAAKAMETVLTYLPVVETAGALIAQLDVLTGFATAAALAPSAYVRPEMLDMGTGVLELKDARHPCVELMDNMSFIANSYDFQKATSAMQIITGPNMGGKSTYIRGLGCIVVMAQVGSFVPCSSARVSIVDCILARVGAGDAVQKGVSTFMAEMLEASVILQTATPNSLLIIDELGRGTSTFDGFGLAWAISEYIVSKIGCLCVFASHFHELTALADKYPQVVNKHVSAHVMDGQLVMLFDVKNGPCKESFGVHVAAMAKFPQCVIDEAKRKASELESLGHDVVSEEGKAKMAKVTKCVDTFAALPLMSMDANEIKSQVTSAVDIAL